MLAVAQVEDAGKDDGAAFAAQGGDGGEPRLVASEKRERDARRRMVQRKGCADALDAPVISMTATLTPPAEAPAFFRHLF